MVTKSYFPKVIQLNLKQNDKLIHKVNNQTINQNDIEEQLIAQQNRKITFPSGINH